MAIGGINNNTNYMNNFQVGRNTTHENMGKLASGKKQNYAAQGAAELAAAQLMEEQQRGFKVGRNNMASGRDAINIADAAQAGTTDYLQTINEDSIRAMNGTMSADDRRALQNNISQMTQGIDDIANQARYNETKVLQGNGADINIVGDSEGSGRGVTTNNATAESLNMRNYSVLNGKADLDAVGGALQQVNRNRSVNGAQSNALEYGMNYNSIARENTIASESRKADTDYADTVTNLRSRQTLDTYRIQMQRQQMLNLQNQSMGILNH